LFDPVSDLIVDWVFTSGWACLGDAGGDAGGQTGCTLVTNPTNLQLASGQYIAYGSLASSVEFLLCLKF